MVGLQDKVSLKNVTESYGTLQNVLLKNIGNNLKLPELNIQIFVKINGYLK